MCPWPIWLSFFGLSLTWNGAARTAALSTGSDLTVADIQSIQAYTDETMYGTGVVEVQVTYKPGVNVSGVTADSYILEDRGSLSPDYGRIKIAGVSVQGQTVTLTIDDGSAATANNKLVYTGDQKEGPRERNVFGIYATGAWYRDVNGVIYYGKEDSGEYKANTTGMGYQSRACLELKLRHAGEAESAAACLANGKGASITPAGCGRRRWTASSALVSSSPLRIWASGSPLPPRQLLTAPRTPMSGATPISPPTMIPPTASCSPCRDRASPTGSCPTAPMTMAPASCMIPPPPPGPTKGAIVVNIHDRSSAGPGEYFDIYDFVVDDVNVMQYFIDTYGVTGNIVLQGNSRGTMASALVIKALAGQAYNPRTRRRMPDWRRPALCPRASMTSPLTPISARMVPSGTATMRRTGPPSLLPA